MQFVRNFIVKKNIEKLLKVKKTMKDFKNWN